MVELDPVLILLVESHVAPFDSPDIFYVVLVLKTLYYPLDDYIDSWAESVSANNCNPGVVILKRDLLPGTCS